MGTLKNKSIKSLLEGIEDYEAGRKRVNGGSLENIKGLFDELRRTEDKRQRERIVCEFKKRNAELTKMLSSDPELVENEIKKALLMAAVGGEYAEEEISIDGRGRKRVKHTRKTVPPDVNAAKELMNMLGGSESAESGIAEAWIKALIGDDDNGKKQQI